LPKAVTCKGIGWALNRRPFDFVSNALTAEPPSATANRNVWRATRSLATTTAHFYADDCDRATATTVRTIDCSATRLWRPARLALTSNPGDYSRLRRAGNNPRVKTRTSRSGFSEPRSKRGPHTELDKLLRPVGNIKLQHAFRLPTDLTRLCDQSTTTVHVRSMSYTGHVKLLTHFVPTKKRITTADSLDKQLSKV